MIEILVLAIIGIMCVVSLTFLIFLIRYYGGRYDEKKLS